MPWFCCVITRKQYRLLIGKNSFPSKNTRLNGYPIYLHKNDLVNIVTEKKLSLLTGADRATAPGFRFRLSVTK